MFHEHEQGPGTTQGARTNASLLPDGTLDYMHEMKIGWQGRGFDTLHMQTMVGGEVHR